MKRWIFAIKERFPLLTYSVLAAGISLSGLYTQHGLFSWIPFILSFLGILLSFAALRLMNDLKDLEKDKIAHPERPLPRGLIKKQEAANALHLILIGLFSYCMIIWVALQATTALLFALVAIYLWLIRNDFYFAGKLNGRPLIRGLLVQSIMIPMVLFTVATARPVAVLSPWALSLAFMLFGAFFCYDICRKLNPHAHPVLGTYIHFFGFRRAFEIATLALVISAMGAAALDFSYLLFPCELLVFFSLALVFFDQERYRVPQIVASLSLMLHAWASVILRYLSG